MKNKLTKLEKIRIDNEIETRSYYDVSHRDMFGYIVFLKSEIDRLKKIIGPEFIDTFESDGLGE